MGGFGAEVGVCTNDGGEYVLGFWAVGSGLVICILLHREVGGERSRARVDYCWWINIISIYLFSAVCVEMVS